MITCPLIRAEISCFPVVGPLVAHFNLREVRPIEVKILYTKCAILGDVLTVAATVALFSAGVIGSVPAGLGVCGFGASALAHSLDLIDLCC